MENSTGGDGAGAAQHPFYNDMWPSLKKNT